MAKSRAGKKREKNDDRRPGLGEPSVAASPATRILPTQLRIGDQLTDETGEYEVIGRPYTTAGGKTANVRIRRVDSDVQMIRTYGAHERVSVKRSSAEEGTP